MNPALGLAIQKAKDANMPNDNIQRAIDKGTGAGSDADAYERITYEGYAPGGVAVLVDVLTDNRNRAASDVRYLFSKNGGKLGTTGSVAGNLNASELVLSGTVHGKLVLTTGPD